MTRCVHLGRRVPVIAPGVIGDIPLTVPLDSLKQLCPAAHDTIVNGFEVLFHALVLPLEGLTVLAIQQGEVEQEGDTGPPLDMNEAAGGWAVSGTRGLLMDRVPMASGWRDLSRAFGGAVALTETSQFQIEFCGIRGLAFTLSARTSLVRDHQLIDSTLEIPGAPIIRQIGVAMTPHDTLRSACPGTRDRWAEADRLTRRLAPSEFVELPAAVRSALEMRHCLIPQDYFVKRTSNVIHGHFARPDRVDWAVLCSVHDTSRILVFWGGNGDAPGELEAHPDRDYLQGIDYGMIGYSRGIAAVDSTYIRVHFERYGGRRPPPLDHDGIDDGFEGKASQVFYWYAGRWLTLTGAD